MSDFGGQAEVNLIPGSIYGLRAFDRHSHARKSKKLDSWVARYTWLPGENRAFHMFDGSSLYNCNNIAGSACSCGFYAYYGDPKNHATPGHVVGVIQAYGKVTVGSKGFRAEKAKIVALVVHGRSTSKFLRPRVYDYIDAWMAKIVWFALIVAGYIGVSASLTPLYSISLWFMIPGIPTLMLAAYCSGKWIAKGNKLINDTFATDTKYIKRAANYYDAEIIYSLKEAIEKYGVGEHPPV